MSSEIQELITDVKAAARLGQIEALQYALDGLLDLPGVAANLNITTAFIQQAVLPIAWTLAQSPVSAKQLSPLGGSDYAACRAVFGAFCAYRYFSDHDVQGKMLEKPVKDARREVRTATTIALLDAGSQDTEKLTSLAVKWIQIPSPRLKAVGLSLLAQSPEEALFQLSGFDAEGDTELLAAVADLIVSIAHGENIPKVFSLLSKWTLEADEYDWVICKALSSPWAAASPATALEILVKLEANGGRKKRVMNALKTLAQHDESGQALTELNERLSKAKST
jgi:hypothetical protein